MPAESTQDAARALAHKAEALLAGGDAEKGMELLRSALDADPLCFEALESLGMVAVEGHGEPAALIDELFLRLDAAQKRADSAETKKRVVWLRLTQAAFFDRLDLVRALAGAPGVLTDDDAAMRAAMGALLFELGEPEAGARLLNESEHLLSSFHRARFAFARGERAGAGDWMNEIPDKGAGGILRETLFLLLGLDGGDTESRGAARRLIVKAEQSEDSLGPHVYSEILYLKLRLALAEAEGQATEGKNADAAWAGEQLGMPPWSHDPGVMVRARKVLGPLYLLRG